MRSARLVSLDLLVARKRVQELSVELIEARLRERDRIVALFKAGKTADEVARAMGMSRGAVQGIYWREGHTVSGKRRMRTPRIRASALSAMLDAKLSLALRHRAPERQMAGGAS